MTLLPAKDNEPGAGSGGSGSSPASQPAGLWSLEAGEVSDKCHYWRAKVGIVLKNLTSLLPNFFLQLDCLSQVHTSMYPFCGIVSPGDSRSILVAITIPVYHRTPVADESS